MRRIFFLGTALPLTIHAQSFLQAVQAYPRLSQFANLYQSFESIATSLLTTAASSPHTVLIPNNDAFLRYETENGRPVTALSDAELQSLLSYHVMVGDLSGVNFTTPKGLTVPTLLTGQRYNNRSAGSALSQDFGNQEAGGQVVYLQTQFTSTGNSKLKERQIGGFWTVKIQSGLGSNVTLTPVDGRWDGGRFQEVDRFLTLPQNCGTTIRNQSALTSLTEAMTRSNYWNELNFSPNYTCLGPDDKAFTAARNPQATLTSEELEELMEFHTITQPLYTNYLSDGQVYQSDNNKTVRVSIKNGQLFFNDARVIRSNIITNNGVLHVLDKVMSEQGNSTSPEPPNESPKKSAAITNKDLMRRFWIGLLAFIYYTLY